jgi:hypothetical protein
MNDDARKTDIGKLKFKRQHKKVIHWAEERTRDCMEKRQKTILKRFVII